MEKLIIEGGQTLHGSIKVSGSKNATLPVLAATLLTDGPCVIRNVPRLRDVTTMIRLLRSLGKSVEFSKDVITVTSKSDLKDTAEYKMVSTMRGSFCVLGPLLAKLHKARVSLPGGCVIGVRPVDLHLKGLEALGARISVEAGYVNAEARELKGTHLYLGGVFGSSVLATANIMMASVLSKGTTVIEYAACEPEIIDLAEFLIQMGALIKGHGTPRITIKGVAKLAGAEISIGPDRIEAGTYLLLAAATRSPITVENVEPIHLMALIDKLKQAGVSFKYENNHMSVRAKRALQPVSLSTFPYPGFPTDLQAQFMALMATTPGVSVIVDKVFPDRFIHIAELNRMGAKIRREGNAGIVEGVKSLYGAEVMASDLRASAALIIAALAAKGKSAIHRIYHLDRGYERMDEKLKALGADIRREKE